jgi:hypothetical protein
MKRKITLISALALAVFTANAQTVLNEGFTAPFTPAAAGWVTQNLSAPTQTNNWFQGNPASFLANSGAPSDYYATNFQAGGNGNIVAGISNWLITPTVSIYNGAILTFATRKVTNTAAPDRLQVRFSTAGATSTIVAGGTPSLSVGTYTNLLLDINPLYSTATTSAVVSGSVNGYPNVWSVYSLTITGVTGITTGRFAFRYFVDNGGLAGANSDFIGIDDVNYKLPCGATVPSYTTCAGSTAILNATGGLPATTYTWNTGANTTSISTTPPVTTVYTLTTGYPGGTCPTAQTSTVTIGTSISVNISASSNTVCSNNSLTLTANSSATTFSWNTGATSPVIVVTPATNTTYSVGVASGLCFGGNTIAIVVNPNPVISFAISNTVLCAPISSSITVTASGANSYTWASPPAATNTGTVSVTTPTVAGNYVISVAGSVGGCVSTLTAPLVVNTVPTLTLTSSSATACPTSSSITLTGSPAGGVYSGTGVTGNAFNPAVAGAGSFGPVYSYTNTATGCSNTKSVSIVVSPCTGIESNVIGLGLNAINVYPNPFTNEITISGVNGSLEVINALGQVVLSYSVSELQTINTTNLAKGIYFLKVKNADDTTSKLLKVIKD